MTQNLVKRAATPMVDSIRSQYALTISPKSTPGSYSYFTCGPRISQTMCLPITTQDDITYHSLASLFPLRMATPPRSFKYSSFRSTWESWRQPTQKLIIDFRDDQYIGTATDQHCSGTLAAKKLPDSTSVGNALWHSENLLVQSFVTDKNGPPRFVTTINDIRTSDAFIYSLKTHSPLHDASFIEGSPEYMCLSSVRSAHTILDMRLFSCADGENAVLCRMEETANDQKQISGPVTLSGNGKRFTVFTAEMTPSSSSGGLDAYFHVRTVDSTEQKCFLDTVDVKHSSSEFPIIFAAIARSRMQHTETGHIIRQTTIQHSETHMVANTRTYVANTNRENGNWKGIVAKDKTSTKCLKEPFNSSNYVPFDFAERGNDCPRTNYALISPESPERSILSKNGRLVGGNILKYRASEDDLDDFVDWVYASENFINV